MDGKGGWGTRGRARSIDMGPIVARPGLERAAEVW